MRKISALPLIFIFTVSSVISISLNHVSGAMPKPSVPEFTVKFVNASYSVTTTNPYTGLSETKLVSNNSIEITIKNQPFDSPGYQIYYNIRVKPHFTDNWTEVYPIVNTTSAYNGDGTFSYAEYINYNSPSQSTSSYTIITFPVVPTDVYQATGYDIKRYFSGYQYEGGTYIPILIAIPDGAQIDFQVQALVGHESQLWVIDHPFTPTYGGHFEPAVAYNGASDWSKTKTIIIPTSTTSPAGSLADQTSTSAPEQENQQTGLLQAIFVALIAIVVCVCLGLLLYIIKRR
ncbi:MAG: hypothetical protein QXL10_03855 [Candidatus Bathyarchaeia archaeon]